MSLDLPHQLVGESLTLLVTLGGPLLSALLAVGLIVGIIQATTQINDQTLSFVPRILTGLGVMWGLGGWMMERMSALLTSAFERMAGGPM